MIYRDEKRVRHMAFLRRAVTEDTVWQKEHHDEIVGAFRYAWPTMNEDEFASLHGLVVFPRILWIMVTEPRIIAYAGGPAN